ncbi:GerAB/ArcD/ProY family transporter [Paenibacillus whitsoniae]|uniref:Uncharacterized protein n=1 Tax=Paenibacillus whitsoniae TaxID=2496558 RepID=A0A430J582_9BACL|nr:endospore germination permease [Paenibacillus whitsoniae]RTE02982.1 hypothetical protein EJQ19_28505 [Paenibacillus whitsoniae]
MVNQDNAIISRRQFMILIVLGVVGDSILILPTSIVKFSKQDAWISMGIALILGMAAGGLFSFFAKILRHRSLFLELREGLGRWLGGLFMLAFLANFFLCCVTLLSELGQFMSLQLMPETPMKAIFIVFLFVIIIAYRYGIEAFARVGEVLFPVFLILFINLVILLIPKMEWNNLRPIADTDVLGISNGVLPAFTAGFLEMVVLLMLVQHVKSSKGLSKPIMAGFAAGGLILFIVVFLCVLVLGPNLMETKNYPTFVLAQKIKIGNFLERVEAIIAILWFITVFYKSLLLFFSFNTGLAQLLKLQDSRMLTIPVGMLLLVATVAGTPSTTTYSYYLSKDYVWFDVIMCLLVPSLALLLLYAAKKWRTR